jgi:hypothetical protein
MLTSLAVVDSATGGATFGLLTVREDAAPRAAEGSAWQARKEFVSVCWLASSGELWQKFTGRNMTHLFVKSQEKQRRDSCFQFHSRRPRASICTRGLDWRLAWKDATRGAERRSSPAAAPTLPAAGRAAGNVGD